MLPGSTRHCPLPPWEGLGYGLLGVICFSFTLPATRLAVHTLDPLFVALGRAAVAAVLAAGLLLVTRQPWPDRRTMRSLAVVALGVILGFPILSSLAMRRTDASHGAILLGLMPLLTAIAGSIRGGESPSRRFWLSAMIGSATVIIYSAVSSGGWFPAPADWLLIGAVVLCSIGYAEGACLARKMAGWQVISWALVISLPLVLPALLYHVSIRAPHGTPTSWAGFFYLCGFSSFLGFFAWYRGLAKGGIAKVSQCQLLQPFLTLAIAAAFLGEKFHLSALLSAAVVVGSIAIGRGGKKVQATSAIIPTAPPAAKAAGSLT